MTTTVFLAAAAPAGGNMSMLLMMVAIFAVFYFFMIRPQQKKQKEIAKWRDALQKGDKVMTAGGIYGTVKSTEGSILVLQVSATTDIKVDRAFVMRDPSDAVQK